MRVPIPDNIAADVLFQHDHTCCVCNQPGKAVQIHHIDEDNTNFDAANLAVLCLPDHNDTQLKGGFGRKLRAPEVIKYRDDWVQRVLERRKLADKLVIQQMATRAAGPLADTDVDWESPSAKLLAVHVNGLPDLLKHAVAEANKIWEGDYHGIVPGMNLIFDVLSGSWVQLASWVDPNHFAEMQPRDFISKFIADRNIWNRMLTEPRSYGERARSGTIDTLDRTLVDLQDAVENTVAVLALSYLEEFDFVAWRKRWDKAKYIG